MRTCTRLIELPARVHVFNAEIVHKLIEQSPRQVVVQLPICMRTILNTVFFDQVVNRSLQKKRVPPLSNAEVAASEQLADVSTHPLYVVASENSHNGVTVDARFAERVRHDCSPVELRSPEGGHADCATECRKTAMKTYAWRVAGG